MVLIAGISLHPAESGMAVMNRQAASVDLAPHGLHTVDISMCRTMSEMRRFSLRKLARLLVAPFRLIAAGVSAGSRVLYLVPSSPSLGGLVKDAWIVAVSAMWFKHRVYHCHSGGVGMHLASLQGLIGATLRRILGRPLAVIRVSESSPADDVGFQAQLSLLVPNCITDEMDLLSIKRPLAIPGNKTRLLFIGLHTESKGFSVLLEAIAKLVQRGDACQLLTIGSFNDPQYEQQCRDYVTGQGLASVVTFGGPKFGRDKIAAMVNTDILVFPTHFECETFGLVVAESMAASLPAVASDWSGLKDLVVPGETGLLTPTKDSSAVAAAISTLCADPELRDAMGARARQRFIAKYSRERFGANFRNAMHQVCTAATTR